MNGAYVCMHVSLNLLHLWFKGRPKAEVNVAELQRLLHLNLTKTRIAQLLNLSRPTLRAAIQRHFPTQARYT